MVDGERLTREPKDLRRETEGGSREEGGEGEEGRGGKGVSSAQGKVVHRL
jgi:hypothetical protein